MQDLGDERRYRALLTHTFKRELACAWVSFCAEVAYTPQFARLQRIVYRRMRCNLMYTTCAGPCRSSRTSVAGSGAEPVVKVTWAARLSQVYADNDSRPRRRGI